MPNMDNAFDVPDSTDWLNTPLSGFASLENALHCQICKEFYDTPMITSCAHTFCSKCIRTSLSADGRCPVCRSADQASKLRNNWAIQEVVSTFLVARESALQVAKRAQEEATESRSNRKRKRQHVSSVDDALPHDAAVRTTRSKSRRLAASQSSQTEPVEARESDGESDFEPEEVAAPTPDDGLVECPLGCGKRMKIVAVEPHLDRCEEERERDKRAKSRTPSSTSAGFMGKLQSAKPLERINELNYSLLKDSAMGKKLHELGIPNWGTKIQMVNRHREWVNLWNANCDSSSPRSKRELLHDLDIWERTQGGRAPSANGLTNTIMRKDFDGASWSEKNKDDFSRLIADAKRKRINTAAQSPTTSSETPPGNDPISNPSPLAHSMEPSPKQAPTSTSSSSTPYADDPAALQAVRERGSALESRQNTEPPLSNGFDRNLASNLTTVQNSSDVSHSRSPAENGRSTSLDTAQTRSMPQNSSAKPDSISASSPLEGARRVPMFAVPQHAVQDIDGPAE